MNQKAKTALLIAAFALFIALAALAYDRLGRDAAPQSAVDIAREEGGSPAQGGDAGAPKKERTKAPDFTVLDADGRPAKLSDHIGKPVVLNFWASWCPPCKGEMPEFDQVHGEVGADVAFMMVDLVDGQRETMEKGAQYVREQGYAFPVYFDAQQQAANAYGIASIPTTVFIDGEGYIVTGAQGAITAATLRKGIDLIR